MNLLRHLADDLRHLSQVRDGLDHLTAVETAYRQTNDPDLLPLRADWIADEADLLVWHLERSRIARVLISHPTTVELHEEAAHWRQCARDLYARKDGR